MILFLYGQDTYRLRQRLKGIIEEYRKRYQGGLNFIRIGFGEKDLDDFRQFVETASMFDEHKLIIVEESFKKLPDFQEKLAIYLKEKKIADRNDLTILFWAEEVKSESGLFKFLLKQAKVQKFELLKPYQLKEWIKNYVKNQGRDIGISAVEKLISYIGNDLWRTSNELDKLIAFGNKTIEAEDIDKLVSREIDINIFNIIDALGEKNKKLALKLIRQYLNKGEDEMYLLNRFVYQFRNLLRIKDLSDEGTPSYLFAKKTGLHDFVAKKTGEQAKNFSFPELKKIYQKLLEIDLDVKTGKIDIKTALELFIVGL